MEAPMTEPADERDALDAYSKIVIGVAEAVGPSVAAVTIEDGEGRPRGAGSAVVFTGDGFLITNAHVVGRNRRGSARFADGSTTTVETIGRDPLSDIAVLRAAGLTPPAARLSTSD